MQPACLLYTRSVMRATAAECVRAFGTARDDYGEEECRRFALRRLAAVPEVSLFHVGGTDDWEVEIERSEKEVSVRIAGHLRPLPLLGITAQALGTPDEAGTRIEASVTERVQADWVGGSYDSWVGMWG